MTIVDAHCHLFNASDLPVRGFVQRVVLGDPEDQVVLGPDTRSSRAALPYLAALLVELLSGPTPTAEAELAAIDDFSGRTLRTGPPGPRREADVERLRRALESVLEPVRGAAGPHSRRRRATAVGAGAHRPIPRDRRGDRRGSRHGCPAAGRASLRGDGAGASRRAGNRLPLRAVGAVADTIQAGDRRAGGQPLRRRSRRHAFHAGADRLLAVARGRAEAGFGPRGPDPGDGADPAPAARGHGPLLRALRPVAADRRRGRRPSALGLRPRHLGGAGDGLRRGQALPADGLPADGQRRGEPNVPGAGGRGPGFSAQTGCGVGQAVRLGRRGGRRGHGARVQQQWGGGRVLGARQSEGLEPGPGAVPGAAAEPGAFRRLRGKEFGR